ncbi:MAG: hypothetical protein ACXAE3_08550 [Candidatus Kariarchaeaceae archaeon]|jgi:ferredoxin
MGKIQPAKAVRNKIVSRRYRRIERKIYEGSELSDHDIFLPLRFNIPTQGLIPISESRARLSLPPLVRSYFGIRKAERSMKNNPETPFRFIDDDELLEFHHYAHELGVNSMGFTKYRDGNTDLTAIVITMELDEVHVDQSPSEETYQELVMTYHNLGMAVNKLAKWLRQHNFYAHAIPPASIALDFTKLAESAGLGFHGLNGMLITPERGPRVRVAAIMTTIDNLPLSKDNLHTWISEYCATCEKCVDNCPGDAVLSTPVVEEGKIILNLDQSKCADQYVESSGCSMCLSRCPFSHSSYGYLKNTVDGND